MDFLNKDKLREGLVMGINGVLRVLHVVTSLNTGGEPNVVLNYYKHIDREKVQFDFVTFSPEKGRYEDEISALGGDIQSPRCFKASATIYA